MLAVQILWLLKNLTILSIIKKKKLNLKYKQFFSDLVFHLGAKVIIYHNEIDEITKIAGSISNRVIKIDK